MLDSNPLNSSIDQKYIVFLNQEVSKIFLIIHFNVKR